MKEFIKNLFEPCQEQKLTEKVFYAKLTGSILSILLCVAMMISSAFAWFSIDETFPEHELIAASFSLRITDSSGISVSNVYVAPLKHEDFHTFVLTGTGTATSGYCKITVENAGIVSEYYTTPIDKNMSTPVNIRAARGSVITFYPMWNDAQISTVTNYFSHSSTPYLEYTVPANCTLDALCSYYSVSVSDVCIYNNITSISEGDVIKIPEASTSLPLYTPVAETEETPLVHIVESGQNLSEIAALYSMSVAELCEINSITDPSHIEAGQMLSLVPTDKTLAEETPVEETPVEETPVEEAPVEETPVEETPVEETPVEEAPVEETPVEETPVEETPVEETPVEEAPVEEAPVEEITDTENFAE